jgi:hypothetical protein
MGFFLIISRVTDDDSDGKVVEETPPTTIHSPDHDVYNALHKATGSNADDVVDDVVVG